MIETKGNRLIPVSKRKTFIYAIVLVCLAADLLLHAQILTNPLPPPHSLSNTTTVSPLVSPIASTTTAPVDQHSPPITNPTAKTYPHLALALKTGSETAASRSSIQLLTFLQDAANLLVIAEAPGVRIGGLNAEDAYSGVYDRIEKKMKKERKGRRGDAVAGGTLESKGWYIMFDDDTYLLLDNYSAHLETLNPADEWYLGQPNLFAGCDGVTNFGDGPSFANGGTGIVVSRGAMTKM
ncbi:hypothetical protein HDU98_009108, partial [Podochytrium sp. JEL0797]